MSERERWRNEDDEYNIRDEEQPWRNAGGGFGRGDYAGGGRRSPGDYERSEGRSPGRGGYGRGQDLSRGTDRGGFGRYQGQPAGRGSFYGGGSRGEAYGSEGYGYEGRQGGFDSSHGSDRERGRGGSFSTGWGPRRDDYDPSGSERDRRRAGEHGRGGQGRDEERDRDWLSRAGDEVASWFGDGDASRRREADQHRGRGPRGYTRSDERIREDVCDRLTDDPRLDASGIEVSVSGGEVTLAGSVDSREARRRAEDVAEAVSGVGHVQNNVRVGAWGGGSGDAAGPAGSPRGETARSASGSTGAAGTPTTSGSVGMSAGSPSPGSGSR